MPTGFLNLHKPQGRTSHDCVGAVRRLLKERRVGHGGTLDPMATGVLPMAVGRYTRLLGYLAGTKGYQARVRFGVATTTDDVEGEILQSQAIPSLSPTQVEQAFGQFIGSISQIPPVYSAIRHQGKHLYELARAGVEVEVAPRTVVIEQITLLDWQGGDQPEALLQVKCGSGTYIRSLARDLGQAVGSCATLSALVRTHSSGFDLSTSVTLEELQDHLQAGSLPLLSPETVLGHLPTVCLEAEAARLLRLGQAILYPALVGFVQVWQGLTFMGVARADGELLHPTTTVGELD